MTYFTNTSCDLKDYDCFVARQFKDIDDGNYFWRLYGVIPNNLNVGYDSRETVLTCDTYEELAIWSDLHSVKIHHKELYPS